MPRPSLPRVTEIDGAPVIGSFYSVPCVRYRVSETGALWIPVIGSAHDDMDHFLAPRHYHFDTRFVPLRFIRLFHPELETLHANGASEQQLVDRFIGFILLQRLTDGDVRWMRRRCLRAQATFPHRTSTGERMSPFEALEEAYQSKKMECLRCPHRGIPLNGQPVKDGVVVCPGHGLAWNVASGDLVPRYAATEAEKQADRERFGDLAEKYPELVRFF
jgi:hypothetical protein